MYLGCLSPHGLYAHIYRSMRLCNKTHQLSRSYLSTKRNLILLGKEINYFPIEKDIFDGKKVIVKQLTFLSFVQHYYTVL
jgi:hypothetical protein